MNRRWSHALSTPALCFLVSLAGLRADERDQVELEVRETAGIRRRSDVVSVPLRLSVPDNAGLRLLRDQQPLPAQFRRVIGGADGPVWMLDFVDHFAPWETRTYVVEFGPGLVSDEPSGGLRLETHDEQFTINSSGVVDWTIRRDLAGLFQFAGREQAYVSADSAGLVFATRAGATRRLSERRPSSVRVQRTGPVACALEFAYEDWPPGAHSTVTLEFLRTKSWVHVDWIVRGEAVDVREIGFELALILEEGETLVDFGAGDFVYTTVRGNQRAILEAGPAAAGHVPWQVLQGTPENLQPQVVASPRTPVAQVPGWAHAMDARRCTALAVGRFAVDTRDRIEIHGDGRLGAYRNLAEAAGDASRRWEFWLHFVPMPVHVGARTSPRSMQQPLEVRLRVGEP